MIAGVSFIIIGIVLVLLCGGYKTIPNAQRTKGSVLLTKEPPHKQTKPCYTTIRYFVKDQEYRLKVKHIRKYQLANQKIIVKYNSKNPAQAIIAKNPIVYIVSFLCFCFGIFLIILAFNDNQNLNTNENGCCTCLDCPECDVCCDCNNPYLSK